MTISIDRIRNIGISAHIDSGKTTLSERILYYTDTIHAMHEVKGKDGVGATMDFMELERERGITITSAATTVEWNDHWINLIDTPGHIDFTIEVERALRVLDGAVLVLCAVGGVQSQTITVDRQLRRYSVPRIAFVNKCDRIAADPMKVAAQLRRMLNCNAVLMQIPIGTADSFSGIIDLIRMRAFYFEGSRGEDVRDDVIPGHLEQEARERREEMLNHLSMADEELMQAYLEERVTVDIIKAAVRRTTCNGTVTPVFLGSAYKNKGVQLLLDAVTAYLPSPLDRTYHCKDLDDGEKEVPLAADARLPVTALAFKLEEGPYGQLTYVRVYQGMIRKGSELINSRTRKPVKVGRLIRMHANQMNDITEAVCGDIVALFGIDCASGDTFCSPSVRYGLTSMYVPNPVISLALFPKDKKSEEKMSKALNRFTKEDPTFTVSFDDEARQTVVRGMGELHLEIYMERMRREYGVDLATGMPQVAYRETISQKVPFDYTHKKQTGGAGQYGRVAGFMEPSHGKEYEFIDDTKGGVIPKEFIPSCDKGFKACMDKGSLIGFPIVGIKIIINDGKYHPVDSSDIAFQQAAIGAFRQAYDRARPKILEPVMKVCVEGPCEFQGNVLATINQRRGIIVATTEDAAFARVEAEIPLQEMFGYSTVLRSQTQGKSEFTMEFLKYVVVPESIALKLIKAAAEKKTHTT